MIRSLYISVLFLVSALCSSAGALSFSSWLDDLASKAPYLSTTIDHSPLVDKAKSQVREATFPFLDGTVHVDLRRADGTTLLQADWSSLRPNRLYNLVTETPETAATLLGDVMEAANNHGFGGQVTESQMRVLRNILPAALAQNQISLIAFRKTGEKFAQLEVKTAYGKRPRVRVLPGSHGEVSHGLTLEGPQVHFYRFQFPVGTKSIEVIDEEGPAAELDSGQVVMPEKHSSSVLYTVVLGDEDYPQVLVHHTTSSKGMLNRAAHLLRDMLHHAFPIATEIHFVDLNERGTRYVTAHFPLSCLAIYRAFQRALESGSPQVAPAAR